MRKRPRPSKVENNQWVGKVRSEVFGNLNNVTKSIVCVMGLQLHIFWMQVWYRYEQQTVLGFKSTSGFCMAGVESILQYELWWMHFCGGVFNRSWPCLILKETQHAIRKKLIQSFYNTLQSKIKNKDPKPSCSPYMVGVWEHSGSMHWLTYSAAYNNASLSLEASIFLDV